jgi:hypothetical protein
MLLARVTLHHQPTVSRFARFLMEQHQNLLEGFITVVLALESGYSGRQKLLGSPILVQDGLRMDVMSLNSQAEFPLSLKRKEAAGSL